MRQFTPGKKDNQLTNYFVSKKKSSAQKDDSLATGDTTIEEPSYFDYGESD
jgi:hypothetical protein